MTDFATVGFVLALLCAQDSSPIEAGGELPIGERRLARLVATDPVLDAHGPAQRFVVHAPSRGSIYLRASATPGSVFVRVQDPARNRAATEGCVLWTPCVVTGVEPGSELVVTVSACAGIPDGEPLDVALEAEFAPETAASLELAARLEAALAEATALGKDNEVDAARAVVVAAIGRLVDLEQSAGSRAIAVAASKLAPLAFGYGAIDALVVANQHVAAQADRSLPADHTTRGDAWSNVGVGRYMSGDIQGAAQAFEEVLAVRERTHPETSKTRLDTMSNLAGVYVTLRDLSAGRALYEQVLELRESSRGADDPVVQTDRTRLATAIFAQGDSATARALFETAIAVQQRLLADDHPELQGTRANLAMVLRDQGELESARALFERVIANRERTLPEDHPDTLAARENLSSVLRDLGDFAGAHALAEALLPACERTFPPDHVQVLAARTSLAITRFMTSDLVGARALFESVLASLELSTRDPDDVRLRDARRSLFSLLVVMGDEAAARPLFDAIASSALARSRSLLYLPAREAAERATKEFSVVELLLQHSSLAPRVAIDQAFELAATASMIAAGIAPHGAHDDAEVVLLRDELAAAREALSQRSLSGPTRGDDDGAFGNAIFDLTRARDAAEAALSAALRARGATTEPISAAALAHALPAGHAVLQLVTVGNLESTPGKQSIINGDSIVALIVAPSPAPSAGPFVRSVTLCDLAALRTAVTKWRTEVAALSVVGAEAAGSSEREYARALRRLVVDPLLATIPDAKTIHVTLDDVLHLVPIEALPFDDGSWVGDRVRIVIEPSVDRLLRAARPQDSEPSLVAVGDVDYGAATTPRFGPLPETGVEVRAIGARFESAFSRSPLLLLLRDATTENLARAVVGARYVHIATHGWCAQDSIRSREDRQDSAAAPRRDFLQSDAARVKGLAPSVLCGIALAEANAPRDRRGRVPGLMTAEALAGIDLSDCSVCVLSACETNVGIRRAGLGVRSLQSAAHTAGARCAITSLWSVDDTVTRRLMDLVYENLWEKRISAADALWLAKSTLRAQGADTSQWAGFVLSGDPDAR